MAQQSHQKKVPVTVANGDGIGPEIMAATLRMLEAAGAQIEPEFVTVGEQAYTEGNPTGITEQAWGSIHCTGIFLKAPLLTPTGGGFKSVNVTLRKSLGLFANVRPAKTYTPFVNSKHTDVDVVVIRENEEDLYAGIEYSYTANTTVALKLITRSGSARIIRYAFEYAKAHGRKKVTALVKDNIMKVTDGLFHKVFKEIASEYPTIEANAMIVDIGMARMADTPEAFDVVVTLNLYGDILSDITSQIVGSVGLAGSMNVGKNAVMFEAIHGCAPDIAGKGIANPSGLLNAALLMLHHIGQGEVAEKLENAWLTTLENGQLTGDLSAKLANTKPLNTEEFADAVIANLGKKPKHLPAARASSQGLNVEEIYQEKPMPHPRQDLVGVDVYALTPKGSTEEIGQELAKLAPAGLELSCLVSRGVKVYPCDYDAPELEDVLCARYYATNGAVSNEIIRNLLAAVQQAGYSWVKVENLYNFDSVRGFSLFQGE